MAFHLLETTIDAIQAAYRAGELSARDLVQLYLNRIEVYDQKGPNINAIITIAPDLLEQADRLDAAYGTSGRVGQLRRHRRRPGGLRLHPPAVGLERHRGDAADRGAGEPGGRL